MRFHRLIAVLIVTLFVGINAFLFSDYLGFEKIRLVTERGDVYKLKVEIADTFEQRQKGLMYRKHLDVGRGMLFVYIEPVLPSFWMKNMRFPLDIIFIGEDLRVKTIHEKVPPCETEPCELYSPSSRIRYVLEVPGGYSSLFKIKPGDRLEFDE
ncbi:DUF192 domain-containing protein [Candidatus Peregrinibacteria bacterium]|nr:DUF192 domain-containing protein [Candidatus Peregrinibacteria bacterium]